MGRRWGKTTLGGCIVGLTLARHGRVAWIAPTYKNSRPLWRWISASTVTDVKHGKMRLHKGERTVETRGGGFLGIYSADNIDSVRGEAFHLVVLDEAARIPEDAFSDAIMPTLADYDGDAILISTPKGKNWFWREFLRGQMGDRGVMSWHAPTGANPSQNIQKAFRMVRERVSEATYRQEWLAEFVDGGEVFRRIAEAATAKTIDRAQAGQDYVIGVDWGKYEDFTVYTVIDVGSRSVVHIDRFNQIDYQVQLSRLQALCDRFAPISIAVERNSIGDPLIEQLKRAGLPVAPFTVTSGSKTNLIDNLALAFERGEIRIPNDPVLVGELQAYEMERLPSGTLRYNAPAGLHDDCVMSLAFAWWEMSESARRAIQTDSVDFYGRQAQPVGMAGFYG